MNDLRDLYQQMIIDHSQHPHNFCTLEQPSHSKEGYNPLCGDKITLYINEENGIITNVCFQGSGCAISTASASLMTDIVKNKTVTEVLELFDEFQKLVTTGKVDDPEKIGKLSILAGVSEFPMRVKCATLPWHTLKAALTKEEGVASAE
ncbi:MAG: SUF system NifU family Fe-S cluster assembly protein [Gammaproteobacteria bacterium]|nr:SUF system NifU family Fe-S cluster assembly protein [Gammaproteobacteria bacterium]